MSNKNPRLTVVSGLGAAAGALLAAALIPAATASADIVIAPPTDQTIDVDGYTGTNVIDVTTSYQSEQVNIFDNAGDNQVNVAPIPVPGGSFQDLVDIYDNQKYLQTDITSNDQNGVTNIVQVDGNSGRTITDLTDTNDTATTNQVTIDGNHGHTTTQITGGSTDEVTVENNDGRLTSTTIDSAANSQLTVLDNPGQTDTHLTIGSDGTLTATVEGNTGQADTYITGTSVAGGDQQVLIEGNQAPTVTQIDAPTGTFITTVENNTQTNTVDIDEAPRAAVVLSGNTGADNINLGDVPDNALDKIIVESGSGPVQIDALNDTSPVYVTVDNGVTGPVSIDDDGSIFQVAPGFAAEFLDGSIVSDVPL